MASKDRAQGYYNSGDRLITDLGISKTRGGGIVLFLYIFRESVSPPSAGTFKSQDKYISPKVSERMSLSTSEPN